MKFSKKHVAAVAAGVAGLFSVGAANAEINFAFHDGPTFAALSLGNTVATFAAAVTPHDVIQFSGHVEGSSTSFADQILFTVGAQATSVGTATSATINGVSGLSSLRLSLYQEAGDVDTLLAFGDQIQTTPGTWTASFTYHPILTSGNYYLQISGVTMPGNVSATYSGAATLAVPEPGTYAMLLAGLGMMGFIARRRTKNLSSFA